MANVAQNDGTAELRPMQGVQQPQYARRAVDVGKPRCLNRRVAADVAAQSGAVFGKIELQPECRMFPPVFGGTVDCVKTRQNRHVLTLAQAWLNQLSNLGMLVQRFVRCTCTLRDNRADRRIRHSGNTTTNVAPCPASERTSIWPP